MSRSEVYETPGGQRFYTRGALLVPSVAVVDGLERDAPRFLAAIREMVHEPIGVEINTTTWKAYLIFSALQLSTSHPDLGAELKGAMTELARGLQELIQHFHPELAEHLEAGWHRDLDAPRRRLPEETDDDA